MLRPSNAEDYFQKIVSEPDPYSFLEALTKSDPPTVETEWLEFKGADKISESEVTKYWSKALSGFANTAGGVLVWGVDARKDQDGIDYASALALAPDPVKLTQQLKERSPQRRVTTVEGNRYSSGYEGGAEGGLRSLPYPGRNG